MIDVLTEKKSNLASFDEPTCDSTMLTQIQLKQFRCFKEMKLEIEKKRVLIEGANGSGKTSLLEALHYLCYLRSFRTHVPQEMVSSEASSFFVRASFVTETMGMPAYHDIQVGFSRKRRLVKIDDRPVQSYKELMTHYRVLTLTQDDMLLVSGGPETRRTFLDQALLLIDPSFINPLKRLRTCLEQRNALLQNPQHTYENYLVWTEQLWQSSLYIQERRMALLALLEKEIAQVGTLLFNNPSITCRYISKASMAQEKESDFESFIDKNTELYRKEKLWGRTLFGVHLDDVGFTFQEKKSKIFASRGQQKLITLLLKFALIRLLNQQGGSKAIFLLDDFMTDFDNARGKELLLLLDTLENQLIYTCPLSASDLAKGLSRCGAQRLILT